MADIQHAEVYFQGRVQGVGFRYAVFQVAKEFEVAGFVQNLTDGRVLVEAEALPGELDGFVAAIQEKMDGYIRKIERSNRLRTPQFSGFVIR
jgi:acylphosphatase